MIFYKRGRPKQHKNNYDLGTVELQDKREKKLTKEPFDLIHEKDLITQEEYIAGNRLRYLYSLKYGISSVRAYNPRHFLDINLKKIDLKHLEILNIELETALDLIKDNGSYKIITNICIHRELITLSHIDLIKIKEGLQILHNFFTFKEYI